MFHHARLEPDNIAVLLTLRSPLKSDGLFWDSKVQRIIQASCLQD
jgi:hypothetical protein